MDVLDTTLRTTNSTTSVEFRYMKTVSRQLRIQYQQFTPEGTGYSLRSSELSQRQQATYMQCRRRRRRRRSSHRDKL